MNPTERCSGELEYDPDTGAYRTCFDASDATPSVTVVAVAESLTGTESTDLEPLYEAVDPVALDRLLTPPDDRYYEGDREVRFTYAGYEFELASYGRVTARPVDAADD